MSGEQQFHGTPVTIRTPWGDELTVLEEDASHFSLEREPDTRALLEHKRALQRLPERRDRPSGGG